MNGPITSCFLTITQVWLWNFSGQYLKQSRICGTLSDIFLEFKEIICHLLTFYFSFCEIIIGAFFIPNPTSSCLKKNPLLFLQNNLWLFDICSLYFFSSEDSKNVFYLLDFCSDEREAKFKEQKFRGSNQFRDHPGWPLPSLSVSSLRMGQTSVSQKTKTNACCFHFELKLCFITLPCEVSQFQKRFVTCRDWCQSRNLFQRSFCSFRPLSRSGLLQSGSRWIWSPGM